MEDYSAALPEDARRYLSRVREGTLHMGNLVDDLLNLARIGRKELNRQVTGLDSVVAEIISEQKRETEGREIEWRIQALPFSDCDPALLKVVMTNLISNAVKYTRPRQRAVIEIGTVEQDGGLVIFVRDNGVGFSMKYADKLFGVFQRLHRVEDFEGTGVGLATVQRIVHKHGGRIWAEAEIDKGATFYFTLAAVAQAQSSTSSESQKEAYAARES
jgi:light-regulated signal transduction histidine kinase (bacteriophytochrome)